MDDIILIYTLSSTLHSYHLCLDYELVPQPEKFVKNPFITLWMEQSTTQMVRRGSRRAANVFNNLLKSLLIMVYLSYRKKKHTYLGLQCNGKKWEAQSVAKDSSAGEHTKFECSQKNVEKLNRSIWSVHARRNVCTVTEAFDRRRRGVYTKQASPLGSQAVKCPFLSPKHIDWPAPQGCMTFVARLFGRSGIRAMTAWPPAPTLLSRPWPLLTLLVFDWTLMAEMAFVCYALTAFNLAAASKACTDGALSIILH